MKEFLNNSTGSIIIATILTILVAIESLYFVPWAPYFLIYAILATVIPIIVKTYKLGSIKDIFKGSKLTIFIVALVVAILYVFAIDYIYFGSLSIAGLYNNPYYNLNLALEELANVAGQKFGISSEDAMLIYGLYVLIWAPIGEELFYRGYLYQLTKEKYGFLAGMLISSFFFGIRHFTHLLFLLPELYLVSAIYWAIHAFFFGFIMVYAYEKTESLYPPMIIHFIVNLASVFAGI
ncbi:MAG: CPBP family intramembrane glutamic endopeptidase [Candidatus Asgardarchaeia archaeon]